MDLTISHFGGYVRVLLWKFHLSIESKCAVKPQKFKVLVSSCEDLLGTFLLRFILLRICIKIVKVNVLCALDVT